MRSPSWQDALALTIVAVFYLGPIIWVQFSRRSRGGAKFGWFVVVLLFSWLGLALFLIVTQALRSRSSTELRRGVPAGRLRFGCNCVPGRPAGAADAHQEVAETVVEP